MTCNDFVCYDPPKNGGCDFESYTSGCIKYVVKPPWNIQQGPTPSEGTGPSTDHTKVFDPRLGAQGRYAYFEADGAGKGLKCMRTPLFQKERCMTFWYHMWGSSKMLLGIRTLNVVGERKPLFSARGSKGNRWIKKSLTVYEEGNDEKYVVQFCAKKAGHKSDIAIDDISFTDGPCAG